VAVADRATFSCLKGRDFCDLLHKSGIVARFDIEAKYGLVLEPHKLSRHAMVGLRQMNPSAQTPYVAGACADDPNA
jgi:hypothetical protein